MAEQLHRITLKIFIISLLFLIPGKNFANTGDTTIVQGFHNLLHQNCNQGDNTFLFPNDSMKFYKILLRYELGCPGGPGGCDIYDRIARLKVKQHTGVMDSTLTVYYTFKVGGNALDSIRFMNDTSYKYSYDTVALQIDSTPLNPFQVVFYSDTSSPGTPTDTMNVWPAYYNQYTFDSHGVATDSVFVIPDSIVYQTYDSVYHTFEVINKYEIARAITPYGQGVVLWFDVSDYRMFLHDSVNLESNVCGYSNGWLVSTDFYFIEGIPPMHVYRVENLWNGTWTYGDVGNPIDNHLQPITLIVDSQSVYEKIRLITTGHGFGCAPNNAVAEFSNYTHILKINGVPKSQHLWRDDCGRNPLYPQGAPGNISTWFYERANWCPGSYVKPHDYNATSYVGANDSLTVDYNLQNYTVSSCPSGAYHPEYYIQSHAIFYDDIHYTNNATIYEIRRPNGAFEFNRMNPGCSAFQPELVIKNYGGDTLNQLDIHYGIDGNYTGTYHWTGNLLLTDTVTVHLPAITFGGGNHTFDIYTELPNGAADEFTYDDTMHVSFIATNIHVTNHIIINLYTDANPTESAWKLKNDAGIVVAQKLSFLSANSLYRDTIALPDGCYNLTVTDGGGDGVCCWSGSGYFAVYDGVNANPIYFSGDYGDWYSTNFSIDDQIGISELSTQSFAAIYPNPATDNITINTGFEFGNIEVSITDVTGRIVSQPVECQVIGYRTNLNLNIETSGLYFVKIQKDDNVIVKRIYVDAQ